ncbi:acyl-CoA N-acyltransferase [Xylariaceae sp. FL0016]|nr:acyl-CoA N-acyltransferase [Xylariaceae sp. FL0016]
MPVKYAPGDCLPYRSTNLSYVPVELSDEFNNFAKFLLTEESMPNLDMNLPAGMTRARVEENVASLADETLLSMYIYHPAEYCPGEREPVGLVSLSKPENGQAHHGCSSLTVLISSEYREFEYASEATRWALRWGFEFGRLHRIEVSFPEWNQEAFRFYEQMGFKMEGMRRKAIWYMGCWHGSYLFGMLEDEWRREFKVKDMDSDKVSKIMSTD